MLGLDLKRVVPFRIATFVLLLLYTAAAAWAKELTIDFDVTVGGETEGTVSIFTFFDPSFPSDQGLSGAFGVLRENPDGSTMTLRELEQSLGQNHLNWFQKVISINPPIPGRSAPFIDPPKGGLGRTWADDVPWYWNEKMPDPLPLGKDPPAPNTMLNVQGDPSGTLLMYFDTPHGQPPGTQINFVTFLISDYGNETYRPFGGFSWTAAIGADGHTEIAALEKGASFVNEYAMEIKNDFGYMLVPEPNTLTLLACAILGFAICRWKGRVSSNIVRV